MAVLKYFLILCTLFLARIHFGSAQCCDVDVTAFTLNVSAINAGPAVPFTFSVTIRNNDLVNAIPKAPAGSINYNMVIKLAAFDLRSVGVDSDTITTMVDPATDANSVLKPVGGNAVSLNPTGSLTLTGSTHLTLSEADCVTVQYICVNIFNNEPLTHYNDTVEYNDWRCSPVIPVCPIDVSLTKFDPAPPNLEFGKTVTQTVTFTVHNDGTTTAQNILAVTGTNQNFQIQLQFSPAADLKNPISTPFTPIWTSSLQSALDANNDLVLTGDITYTLPTTNDCDKLTHVCALLSVPPGASYAEPTDAAAAANNVQCQPVTVDCTPVFLNLPNNVSLPENTVNAPGIFTANITGNVTYNIQSTSPKVTGSITISSDGVVSLSGMMFDYETTKTYEIVVEAVAAGPQKTATGTLTLNITDINEAPNITLDNPTVSVSENYVGPLLGYTISKTDFDVNNEQTMVYSIQNTAPANGPFFITNSSTGAISIGPPGLDYETTKVWELVIIGVDQGPPIGPNSPPLTATTTLTVSVLDVPEGPVFINLPDSIDVLENVTDALDFKNISVFNPENKTVTFLMMPNPLTSSFTLNGNVLSYVANPGFDYEKQQRYVLTVFATDGTNLWSVSNFTVNIVDVPEPPFFVNLPNNFSVSENFDIGAELFYVGYGATYTNPVTILNISKSYLFDSGMDKFKIYNTTGLVHTRWRPDLNYEVDSWYNLTIQLCAGQFCLYSNLTVFIEDENEYPVCNPDNFTIVVPENTPVGTNVGLSLASSTGLKYVTDPDIGDSAGTGVSQSTFSSFITIAGNNVQIAQPFNFDTFNPPHKFTVTINVSDTFPQDVTQRGLTCNQLLTVEVLNVDDGVPTFDILGTYVFDVFEDAPAGTVLGPILVTDKDLGLFGVDDIIVDPAASIALKYFGMGPVTHIRGSNTANLLVAGKLDAETDTLVVFNLLAKDTVHTTIQQVIVRIHNVNDNRPIWAPDFYNWEVSSTAEKGKYIITVKATDADIIYNEVSYQFVQVSNEFSLNFVNGSITAKAPPYPDWQEYVVYMAATDNDPNPMSSLVGRVRIDTYKNEVVLTNWTVNCPFSTFSSQAVINNFLLNVQTVCYPCVPRVHAMYTNGTQTTFLLYFLTDNTTDSLYNIGRTKTYIDADEIMRRYTTDQVTTPTTPVKTNPALSASCPVTSITYYKKLVKKFNWIIDTVDGNLFLGLLMSIIWTTIITTAICIARRYFKDRGYPIKRMDTPSKIIRRKPDTAVSQSEVSVVPVQEGEFNTLDFRYADRAHVKTAEESKVRNGGL